MQPTNTSRFSHAIIAIIAVGIIAMAVILALRSAAPETDPASQSRVLPAEQDNTLNLPNQNRGENFTGSSLNPVNETTGITISEKSYQPSLITVEKGTKVTWTNKDTEVHTVTSKNESPLNSDQLSSNETYSHTFNASGEFDYYSQPHPDAKGTVQVVAPTRPHVFDKDTDDKLESEK